MTTASVGLDEFLAARSASLLRLGYALTGDWQRAEDLVQTALVSCFGRWERIQEPEAYLRQVMVRAHLGWSRRRWWGETPSADPPENASAGASPLLGVELRGAVMAALASLPRRQRAVVVLRFYLDLSEAVTADLLGVSVGTVKSQASKGLAALRAAPVLTALLEEERR